MKNATITFRLNEQEKAQLEQQAEKLDIPVSQLIRVLIKEALATREENANA